MDCSSAQCLTVVLYNARLFSDSERRWSLRKTVASLPPHSVPRNPNAKFPGGLDIRTRTKRECHRDVAQQNKVQSVRYSLIDGTYNFNFRSMAFLRESKSNGP